MRMRIIPTALVAAPVGAALLTLLPTMPQFGLSGLALALMVVAFARLWVMRSTSPRLGRSIPPPIAEAAAPAFPPAIAAPAHP